MNNQTFIRFILSAAVAVLIPATVFADDDDTSTNLNHFRVSARAGFNITGRFKNLGTLTLPPCARTTPDGTPYNYNNGYVLTDISGNAGGQTWNWGYDGPGQISGNSILMSRSAPGADAASGDLSGDDANLGFELTYDRELGHSGNWHYGVEGAVNYTRVSFNDSSSFMGNLVQTVDAYGFTPGTTPPATPPAYQGTFNGPGFLLNSTPSSSSSSVVGNTVVTGQRQFSSDIWGTRVGPYVEYPLTKNLDVSLSAGLAAAVLVNSASWNETIFVTGNPAATSVGSGNSTGFVWGGYVSANVSWQFYKAWRAEGGVQFQDLGTYSHDVGSRAVELDLSKSIFVTLGVGCKF